MSPIPNFPNYFATTEGGIYSSKTKRMLKPRDNGNGYLGLVLRKDNKPYTKYVHRLVASAFLGDSFLEVNHKDGNKSNNRLENLEYVTSSENKNHAYRNGLKLTKEMQIEKDGFGIWSPSQKLLIGVGGLTQQDLTKIGTGVRLTAKGWKSNNIKDVRCLN